MSTKYFVNDKGDYLGGFDGAQPPIGSIEVPFPPMHASQKWDGLMWGKVPTDWLRRKEYINRGVTFEALMEAIVESVAENRPEKLQALQTIRDSIKKEFPKQ